MKEVQRGDRTPSCLPAIHLPGSVESLPANQCEGQLCSILSHQRLQGPWLQVTASGPRPCLHPDSAEFPERMKKEGVDLCLFIVACLKGRVTKRVTVHWFTPPNPCESWGWTRPKPSGRSSIQVSYTVTRTRIAEP